VKGKKFDEVERIHLVWGLRTKFRESIHTGSKEGREFLFYVGDYWLFKTDSVHLSLPATEEGWTW